MSEAGELTQRFLQLGRRSASARPTGEPPTGNSQADLNWLTSSGFYKGQIKEIIKLPGEPARYGQLNGPVDPRIADWLARNNIHLYIHQCEFFETASQGNNVILATPTASGKTLAFNLTVFNSLLADSSACALYLYPTKALAYDQLETLAELDLELGTAAFPAAYDGDTPLNDRNRIKEKSRIIITNPHALHLYLGWPKAWERFFASLRYIVIDEAHYYTGATGTAFKMLLNRINRLCKAFGANPQYLAASATIANPRQHLETLSAKPFEVITRSGAIVPDRELIIWDAARDPSLSPSIQSAYLARLLMRTGRRTIVFSNSRSQAELVAKAGSDRANRIMPYRAGYRPELRRQIESDLREGRLKAVSATSALELGVDIGLIDTVILNGYPGSIAATWQRLGRAGRSGKSALGFLVLGLDLMSRVIATTSSHVLAKPSESATVAAADDELITRTLVCAGWEMPITLEEARQFDSNAASMLEGLVTAGTMTKDRDQRFSTVKRPHLSTPFLPRESTYSLILESREQPTKLETLTRSQAMKEAHRGAIYHHLGQPYRIKSVDHERFEIRCRPENTLNHTVVSSFRTVTRQETIDSASLGPYLALELAKVLVIEQVISYKEFSSDGKLIKKTKLDMPSNSLSTQALYITLNSSPFDAAETLAAWHSTEHALIKVAPLLQLTSEAQIAGTTLANDGTPTVILYQTVRSTRNGPIQIAFDRASELLHLAKNLIDNCSCKNGCPFCVMDFRCDEHEPLKDQAGKLIGFVLDAASRQN